MRFADFRKSFWKNGSSRGSRDFSIAFLRSLQFHRIPIVIRRCLHNRIAGHSAEIAYNAIFSMFPAILTLLTAIGTLNLPESQLLEITHNFNGVIPEEAIALVRIVVDGLRGTSSQRLFSLSFGLAIVISSNVMGSIMSALDQINHIPKRRRRPFWKSKLVAIALSVGTLVLFVGSIATLFIGDLGVELIQHRSHLLAPIVVWVWQILSLPLSSIIFMLTLAFIYRYGPSRWRKGSPILPGVLVATGLWSIVSGGFRFYVINFGNYNQVYGAIGAVIILLLWLYVSAFVLLIGAQVNNVLEDNNSKKQMRFST
jgi:membrane protein